MSNWKTAAIFTGILLAGCNGSDDGAAAGPPLKAEFSVKDKFDQAATVFTAGEEMTFELTVTNTRNSSVVYELTSPGHNIYVKDGEDILWAKFHGRISAQVLRQQTMGANQVLQLGATWNGEDSDGNPVPPGDYEVVPSVVFWVDGELMEEPDPVTVEVR